MPIRLSELQTAGIPMRKRLASYILHWKMMLFHGQNVVEFSGANYSAERLASGHHGPLRELHGRGDLLHQRHGITNSFRTKFDDHWVDTDGLGQLRQHHAAAGAALRQSSRRIRR